MAKDRYHAFYTDRYNSRERQQKTFDFEEDLIKFVKTIKDKPDYYCDLIVIWGEEVEFEPATVVETWRIKE